MANPDRQIGSKEAQPKPDAGGSVLALVILARYIQFYDGLLQRVRQEGQGRVAARLLTITLATLLAFAPDSDSKAFASISEADKTEGTTPTPEPTETAKSTPTATRTPEATATPERELITYTSARLLDKIADDYFDKVRLLLIDEYPLISDATINKAIALLQEANVVDDILDFSISQSTTNALGEVIKASFTADEDGEIEGVDISLNNAPIRARRFPVLLPRLKADQSGVEMGTEVKYVILEIPDPAADESPVLLQITDEQVEAGILKNEEIMEIIRPIDKSKYGFLLLAKSVFITESALENPQGLVDLKGAVIQIRFTLNYVPHGKRFSNDIAASIPLLVTVPLTTNNGELEFNPKKLVVDIDKPETRQAPTATATKRVPKLKPTVTPDVAETPDATATHIKPKGAGIKIDLATATPSN